MKKFKTAKHIVLVSTCIVCAVSVHAKTMHFNTEKNNVVDTLPTTSTSDNDTAIQNKLVRLALAQPQFRQTDAQNKILDYQLRKQRSSWLNLLSLSTTYNDQSFGKAPNGGTTAYVYPKYYFGVTVPLGLIVSNGTDVKITRQSQIIAKEQQLELAKSIRAEVLKNYIQYKADEKLLVIQNQILDDQQANFLQVEQKFRNGTATLDEYNDASKKYNDQSVTVINLQLQQDIFKVELERLIGMSLEDALK